MQDQFNKNLNSMPSIEQYKQIELTQIVTSVNNVEFKLGIANDGSQADLTAEVVKELDKRDLYGIKRQLRLGNTLSGNKIA